MNQNIISHLINKKIRKLETDYKEEIYDNSTDEIEEIEKNNIIIFNVTKNLIIPKIDKPKYSFLLLVWILMKEEENIYHGLYISEYLI